MSFAEKIFALRTESGLSQEALADMLCVSRQAVSKWESGSTLPETDKLIRISERFGVTLDYLLKDETPAKPLQTGANLDRVILRFLGSAQDIDAISKILIDIISDGMIDENEYARLDEIMTTLDEIAGNIQDIRIKMAESRRSSR